MSHIDITEVRFAANTGSVSILDHAGLKDATVYRDSVGVYRLYTDSPGEDAATLGCKVYPQLPSGSTAKIHGYAPISISVVDGGSTYQGFKLQFVDDAGSPADCDAEVYIERH